MKIIFMGTAEFAVPSLKLLLNNSYEIAAVITAPDKPRGRGLLVSPSPVKAFASNFKLCILQPLNLRSEEFINKITTIKPDLAIVVAFRILPKELYSIPLYGSVNLHASLLPQYRGAAPINWAIINGETQTGVTTFFIDESIDTGKIIEQRICEILPEDNAGSLHDKLAVLGAETILSTVEKIRIAKGNLILSEQDESKVSYAPKIFRKDCEISWNQESYRVHNFIRGLSPLPAAFCRIGSLTVKVLKSALTDKISAGECGTFIVDSRRLFAACTDRLLEIVELKPEGRNVMSSAEFISGYKSLF